MTNRSDNGVVLALLAAGLIGLGGALRSGGRNVSGEGSCAACGVPMRGSRGIAPLSSVERKIPLFLERREQRSGWLVPFAVSQRIAQGRARVLASATRTFNNALDSLGTTGRTSLLNLVETYSMNAQQAQSAYMATQKTKYPIQRAAAKKRWQQKKVKSLRNSEARFAQTTVGLLATQQYRQIMTLGVGKIEDQHGTIHTVPPWSLSNYADFKINQNYTNQVSKQFKGSPLPKGHKYAARKLTGIGSGRLWTPLSQDPEIKFNSASQYQISRQYLVRVIHYMRFMYVNRAWALHVFNEMTQAGVRCKSPEDRLSVKADHSLWDSVEFRLTIAGRVPDDALAKNTSMTRASINHANRMIDTPSDLVREQVVTQKVEARDQAAVQAADVDVVAPIVVGSPVLRFYKDGQRMSMWWVSKQGAMQFVRGRDQIPLMTATSKMSSPSFSLPAYTTTTGGTCPAASVADARMAALTGLRGRSVVICTTCYAIGAGYGYANVMTDAAARYTWVQTLLKRDMGRAGEVAGYMFATMLASYALYGKGSNRKGQEIGVWDARASKIKIPSKRTSIYANDTPLRIATYNDAPLPTSTRAMFAKRNTPNGVIAGFFRLHDSGDLYVWKYTTAWTWVAKLLPYVYIWTPTRVWVRQGRESASELMGAAKKWYQAWINGNCRSSASWRLRSQRGSANVTTAPTPGEGSPDELGISDWYLDQDCDKAVLPIGRNTPAYRALRDFAYLDNVALRPSALYIKEFPDDPVAIPTLPGLSAGSGVARKYNRKAWAALKHLRDVRGVRPREDMSLDQRREVAELQKQFKSADAKSKRKTVNLTYPPVCSMPLGRIPAQLAYQCPVYTENAQGKEMKSCQAANCRACWIIPDLPIFYGAH